MKRWEGESRPTHFQGVATVVTKLFNLIQPDRAYFGQKDYQQYLVIRHLVKDLNLDVQIVRCPTVRERDGLALSSRNRYLSPKQRQRANILFEALSAVREAINAGQRSVKKILKGPIKKITSLPNTTVEYFAVCDAETLEPLTEIKGHIVALGALRIANIRLIDNLVFRVPEKRR